MYRISSLLSGAVLVVSQLFAQENTTGTSRFELGIYHNMSSELPINFSSAVWNNAVPNFNQVETGYTAVNQSGYQWNYSNPFTYLRGTFGFGNATNDAWVKPKLAFTFGGFNNIYLSDNFSQEKRFVYDTLTSSQTGNQYFMDSVYQINRHRNFEAKMISFGIGAHFEKAITKRFSAEFGFDAIYSFSMNSRVNAYEFKSAYTAQSSNSMFSYYDNYNSYYGQGKNIAVSDTEKMSVSIFTLQLPIEFNMVLSTKANFFNQVKLGVTYNPTFSFATLNEVKRNYFSAPVGVTLKYHFK
jgi:hypothetical protein